MPNAYDSNVRRRCLLISLWAADSSMAGVDGLQRELRVTHGMPVSADLMRGDLTWLQEQGFCKVRDDVALLTERGREVATGVAPWPGG